MARRRTEDQLNLHLEVHAGYELRNLLIAATMWDAAKRNVDAGRFALVDLVAADSVYLHARNLYEFLVGDTRQGRAARDALGLPALQPSVLWLDYGGPLHRKVMHLPAYGRPFTPGQQPGDELPRRVVDLAKDVLELWDALIARPEAGPYRRSMTSARADAVTEAIAQSRQLGTQPLFDQRR